MKRQFVLAAIVAFACAVLVGAQAVAGPTHPTFGSFVNASGVPAGSRLVLNVTYKVTNDEDSGLVGYWALDDYNKQLQVWQAPDKSTFYVVARYTGTWRTFAGALSPGVGASQLRDASGTMQGGYFASFTFTGDVNPAGFKAAGNIGVYDYGGTEADVLLGRYGAGQKGPVNPTGVLGLYFPGYTVFDYLNWGWTYHAKGQSWNNFDYGCAGDILF